MSWRSLLCVLFLVTPARADLFGPQHKYDLSHFGADCRGLVDSDTAVAGALSAVGELTTDPLATERVLYLPAGCMPALGSTVTVPDRVKILCEDDSAGFKPEGKVCSSGRYVGAACGADSDCNFCGSACTGATCIGTQFAPDSGTAYSLLNLGSDVTIEGCTLSGHQVDPYGRCAADAATGKPCYTVCSTNASGSTTPALVLGLHVACNTTAACVSTVGSDSTCLNLADCTDNGTTGECTSAPGNPAGAGDIKLTNTVGSRVVLTGLRVADVRFSTTALNVGDGTVRDLIDQQTVRHPSTLTAPGAPDIDKLITGVGGVQLTDVVVGAGTTAVDITSASKAVLDRVRIRASPAATTGISCAGSGACAIRGATIEGGTTGISCSTPACQVLGARVLTATTGISVSGAGAVVQGAVIDAGTNGIVSSGNRSAITGNTVSVTTKGIDVTGINWSATGNTATVSGGSGAVAFAPGGTGGTMSGNTTTASATGAVCVGKQASQQLTTSAHNFYGCWRGAVGSPSGGLENWTITGSRFMGVDGSTPHAEQIIFLAAGGRAVNNYFNLATPPTARFCNNTCSDKGDACTDNGDCSGCSGVQQACLGAALISLGHPTYGSGTTGSGHVEVRDNLLYDPLETGIETTAIRLVGSGTHNDPIISGNSCLDTSICIDAGSLTSTNKIVRGMIRANSAGPAVATFLRLPSADSNLELTVRDNTLVPGASTAWVNDTSYWYDYGTWRGNIPASTWDLGENPPVLYAVSGAPATSYGMNTSSEYTILNVAAATLTGGKAASIALTIETTDSGSGVETMTYKLYRHTSCQSIGSTSAPGGTALGQAFLITPTSNAAKTTTTLTWADTSTIAGTTHYCLTANRGSSGSNAWVLNQYQATVVEYQ